MWWLRLTVALAALSTVHSYKILALFAHPGMSHVEVFAPVMKALAQRGHEVTVVSHYPLDTPIPNYTDIRLGHPSQRMINVIDMDMFQGGRLEKWTVTILLNYFAEFTCKDNFATPALQEFIRANDTFDIVIAEFFNSDCFLGFVHKFKAPLIGISSSTIMHWTNARFGNPSHPAYIPINFMDHSDRMSFLQRVESVLVTSWNQLFFDLVRTPSDENLIRENFGEDTPPVKDIVLKSSLMLVNTHFSLSLPRPLVPAIVEIGGIHVAEVKQLPEHLEKWISESPHGVIYFSLGSMIKGHTFPEAKRHEFLKAFGRLPQRVLWKWENDTMPGKPDNVMIQKWMPQLDILCHPNVKAFISHGGLLGMTEAVHCGVPAVVMPQYGDQHTNARALEANGGGVILQLYEATEEKVYQALKTILDPEFQKGAKELSARFKDRPMPPLETAIYWVEYVARHRGAHHMRTAAVGMPLYKYLLLDVLAFLLFVGAVFSFIAFYITRALFRRVFGRKGKQKTN